MIPLPSLRRPKLNTPPWRSAPKLNIGCGRRFHADWVNLDLVAHHPQVQACNVTEGLPFGDNYFEAVYHSHVLEHLTPEQGRQLIQECHRVLQPQGVLRIVIPDLERIAKVYLQMHEQAWAGDESAAEKYTWIKLELLDQLVRHQSGGMMGRYMASLNGASEKFVRSRIGTELDLCRQAEPTTPRVDSKPAGRFGEWWSAWRGRAARRILGWLMGKEAQRAFDETLFRTQGEIHRWMYDRFSLRQLCEECGFEEFHVCAAEESDIDSFNNFHLDTDGERIFKPDSLYVECRKPRRMLGTG